jgi:hypothetical protein
MSMSSIRKAHGVPAKRGQRVRYTRDGKPPEFGTIRSADGGWLYVRLDGEGFTRSLHPTCGLEYLDPHQQTIE